LKEIPPTLPSVRLHLLSDMGDTNAEHIVFTFIPRNQSLTIIIIIIIII